MNKIIGLALACGALIMALTFSPQPAQALCSPGAIGVLPDPTDERSCQRACRHQGCSSYYLDPEWGICYCS
jgi:hypothetical protein